MYKNKDRKGLNVIRERGPGGSRITGIGHYVPERVLSNFDLEQMVDTSNEWIVTRTGIRERRVAAPEEATSDMALYAARAALEDAGVDPGELDLILVATVTPDMQFPSTACILQNRLGASHVAGFDIAAACSGFVYGLTLASAMIETGRARKVLLVGVELLTRILDYRDRATCVLLGDGAGAVVLEPAQPEEGILGTFIRCDGAHRELLFLPGGGSRMPLTAELIAEGQQYLKMKGDGLFKYAVRAMVEAAHRTLEEAGLKASDVDYLIPHQANIRIIEGVRKRLKLSREQVVVNIDRIGNTSSASIPIALSELRDGGTLHRGNLVMMVAFGGGLTWGAVLMRY